MKATQKPHLLALGDRYPTIAPPTDEEVEALRLRNSLVMLTETPEQRERRREAVRGVVRKVFAAALFHLGYEEARTLWAASAKLVKPRGAPKGPRRPDKDAELLRIYDLVVEAEPNIVRRLPRLLGTHLDRERRREFGAGTAGAIGKRLRRLLEKRRRLVDK